MGQKYLRRPDDIPGGGDGYDTDMDDKMGLARSPTRHPLQDTGLDIQATQAGVSCPALLLPCIWDDWSSDAQLCICHAMLIGSTCCPCSAASGLNASVGLSISPLLVALNPAAVSMTVTVQI